MKLRFFSLLLAFVLAAGLAAPPVSAATEEDTVIQTVRALGIMNGDENGRMNLEDEVTRAQFAKMLATASVYKDSISSEGAGYSLYSDVKNGHWASEYIRLAAREGWMIGYADGSFHPEGTITLEEGCTALLRVLGYDSSALAGTYPQAQLGKAAALGLREGLTRAQGDRLLRSDCARLICNMLTAETAAGQIYAVTLDYSVVNGAVDYTAVLRSALSGPYIAAGGETLSFRPLTVYRDGKVTGSPALNPHDVYYLHEGLRTLWICTERVSGKVEDVSPATGTPTSVTVRGKTYALSNPDAAYRLSALAGKAVGTYVTLLLGMDGDAVGLLTGDAVNAVSYGVVQSAVRVLSQGEAAAVWTEATVLETDGASRTYTLDREVRLPVGSVAKISVTGTGVEITAQPDLVLAGAVDAAGTSFRGEPFAENLQLLEVEGDSTGRPLSPDRLAGLSLAAGDIRFLTRDEEGRIDRMILSGVTGDTRTYALLLSAYPASMDLADTAYTYLSGGQTVSWTSNNMAYPVKPGGIAIQSGRGGSVESLRQLVSLELDRVGETDAAGEGKTLPLAEEVQVYYLQGGNYYPAELSAVRGEGYRLTGWYDDLGFPAGGRVRLIVAEPAD